MGDDKKETAEGALVALARASLDRHESLAKWAIGAAGAVATAALVGLSLADIGTINARVVEWELLDVWNSTGSGEWVRLLIAPASALLVFGSAARIIALAARVFRKRFGSIEAFRADQAERTLKYIEKEDGADVRGWQDESRKAKLAQEQAHASKHHLTKLKFVPRDVQELILYRNQLTERIQATDDPGVDISVANFNVKFDDRAAAMEEIHKIDSASSAALIVANNIFAAASNRKLLHGMFIWGAVATLGVLGYVGATHSLLLHEIAITEPFAVEVHFQSAVPDKLTDCAEGTIFEGVAVAGTVDRPRVVIKPATLRDYTCEVLEIELSNTQAAVLPLVASSDPTPPATTTLKSPLVSAD